jgi:(1->4)-alpha-D-glucan 1-alpha-D-glucosylmutase
VTILAEAAALAKQQADPATIDALADLLKAGGSRADRFRTRFQQTSAALQAKAVEDTVFYRFNRLLSAIEVGADPASPTMPVLAFHERMMLRAGSEAIALNATATHDTKRGEDARMRIAAIAEAPADWLRSVRRFDELIGDLRQLTDPNTRWLFYQSLLGAWTSSDDTSLIERIRDFLLKAAREAKLRTSWVDRDEVYEAGLSDFVEGVLSNDAFRNAFDEAAAPFIRIGERKSLVQLGLKLFAPGIPDIYQGTEFADLSLVDPDNRRPVDFALRQRLLEDNNSSLPDFARHKLGLLRFGLRLRRAEPLLFRSAYVPMPAAPGIVAFKREKGGRALHFIASLSGLPDIQLPVGNGRVLDEFPRSSVDAGLKVALVERISPR